MAPPVAKKNAIKQRIQPQAKGRYHHLLDTVLARNNVIAKIDKQKHNRVKGMVARERPLVSRLRCEL